jgi:hypothetical protein
VSTVPPEARDRPSEVVAGFLAALAMVGGLVAAIERPVMVGLIAIFISFVGAALAGPRNERLAAAGVTVASLGFLTGMIVSVITSRPLW